MPKPKPSQKTPRKLVLTLTALYLLTVAGLGTALLLTLHAHHAKMQQITAETGRFATARPAIEKTLLAYQSRYGLQQLFPIDACYQTEKGEFDNGKLTCRVGFKGIVNIPKGESGEVALKNIVGIANSTFGVGKGGYGLGGVNLDENNGVFVDGEGSASVTVDYRVQQPMFCTLDGKQGPRAVAILPATSSQVAIRISCEQHTTIPYFEHGSYY